MTATQSLASSLQAGEIRFLSIDELEESPFNPRKTTDSSEIAELAESIKQHGIINALIIREMPIEGDVVSYQVLAGGRRWSASRLAGVTDIPCIVRQMTDDEAREIAISDNLQRKDMEPLEEAQAFCDAMTLAKNQMLTVQELAARLGKSPVYISRRLTLLDAIAPVQDALRKRLIEVGHALELARLSEDEQERLLYWLDVVVESGVRFEYDEDAELDGQEIAEDQVGRVTSKSVLELRKYISNTTLQILSAAPFDPNDAGLVEEAGSCADCLKRSGSSPLLFSDVAGDDVCTDRSCFDHKTKSFVLRKLADAKAEKRPLHQITEDWQKKGPQFHYAHSGLKEAGSKRCGFLVEAIHIDGRDIGKVVEICIGAECKVHGSRNSGTSRAVPSEKAKADRKALLAKVRGEKEYRLALFKELMAKPVAPEPTDAMVQELVAFALTRVDSTKCAFVAETLGWPVQAFSWMLDGTIARLNTISQGEAIRIALVALKANELTVHEYDLTGGKKKAIGLENVAKLFGVDHAAIRASVAKPLAPKPAAKKAAKKAVKKAAKTAPAKAVPTKSAPAKKAAKKAPAKKAAVKKAVRK